MDVVAVEEEREEAVDLRGMVDYVRGWFLQKIYEKSVWCARVGFPCRR